MFIGCCASSELSKHTVTLARYLVVPFIFPELPIHVSSRTNIDQILGYWPFTKEFPHGLTVGEASS